MSDQEHTTGGPESDPEKDGAEVPQPEQFHVAEPQLIDPDTVQLSDAEVSPETIEPELSVSADDVQLVEPSLNPAQISEETARAASLEETAAEARRVEQEALDAGQLVAGTVAAADPTSKATPVGTAPAGGAAGDTGLAEDTAEPHASGASDAGHVPDADSGGSPEAEDFIPDNTDAGRALPNFAADAAAPQWTAAVTDELRWERLFVAADPESDSLTSNPVSATSAADTADATATATATATAAHHDDTVGEMGGASAPTIDPASLPIGMSAPPAASPDGPPGQPGDPGQPGGYPEVPAEQATQPPGGPYGLPPAGTRRRDERHAAGKGQRSAGLLIGGALLGLLALGLLIWGLVALIGGLTSSPESEPVSNGTPGADGIIAENVLPLDIEEGQCLRDFVDINSASTVVTCSTPHNAQLLATEFYADDDEFPGDDALALRAQEVCDGVNLDEGAAASYENLELLRVTPRQGAWSDGDRRVDCLVTSDEGNVISETLINN